MSVALVARVFDTQANQRFEVSFERFPVRIGRNQLNDLHIDRPYVSQFHAALDVRDGRIFVRDLGSTNGTVHKGVRLQRDTPLEISPAPEFSMGPIVVQVALKEGEAQKGPASTGGGSVLDDPAALRAARIQVGAEDPFVRQNAPYVEAYRSSWAAVYRVIYDHLGRVPAEARNNYLRRLGGEYPGVAAEADFQKLAQYYGVESRLFADISPAHAAHAALVELARTLSPGTKIEDAAGVLGFAKRLRDSLEVFLKCFVSLRDGYQEFQAEMLARERATASAPSVATAKDAKELGVVLLGTTHEEPSRELQGMFVDVMAHQVALLTGVMEGVRSLLDKLSPKAIEGELDKKGKKGGLFSSRFEELWKLYETRHGDYAGEDKETFLIIFGPQFSRAYAATAGEEAKATGDGAANLGRFTIQHPGPLPTPKR